MHGIKLAGLTSAIAEAGQDFKRIAKQYVDFFIRTVSQENVFLLGILGKGDVPDGPVTQSFCGNKGLFDESPVFLENLDAVVRTVADIEVAVVRKLGAVHWITELLGRRRIGIVGAEVGVVGLLTIGAPVALVLSGFRVIDDDAVIAVAIGYIQLVGSVVDKQFRRSLQVFGVVAALALARVADLHEEFAALSEFQDHVVMVALGIRATAVAADPHVAFVIYGDAMVRIRPIVTSARATPVPDEVAFFIELKNGRSRNAALRSGRFRSGVNFHGFVGIRAMDNPDVVLGVHGYADGHALDPMVGKRLRPEGVHFKLRRFDGGGSDGGSFFEDGGNDAESGEKHWKRDDQTKFVLHCFPPLSCAAR